MDKNHPNIVEYYLYIHITSAIYIYIYIYIQNSRETIQN